MGPQVWGIFHHLVSPFLTGVINAESTVWADHIANLDRPLQGIGSFDWNLQCSSSRIEIGLRFQSHIFAKHIPGPCEAEALANHLWIIQIRPTRVASIGIALPNLVHGRAGGVIDAQRGAEQILMQNRLHGFRLVLHGPRVGEHHFRHGKREYLSVTIRNQHHLECGTHLEIPKDQRTAGRHKIGTLLRRDAWDILGFQSPTYVAPGVSIIGDSAPESYASNL